VTVIRRARSAPLAVILAVAAVLSLAGAAPSAVAAQPSGAALLAGVPKLRATAARRSLPPAAVGPSAAALLGAEHFAVDLSIPMRSVGGGAATLGVLDPDRSARPAALTAGSSTATVVVQGHGFGNGVGLGQWGAYGYATVSQESWPWIVEHYYAGTYLEPVAAALDRSEIAVHLLELDGQQRFAVSANRPGATLQVNGQVVGRSVVISENGSRQVVTPSAGDVRVQLPGVGWRFYPGYLVVQPDGQTWNMVPLEDYVSGVIPAESPASWGGVPGGEAALQAQAIASRSYALAYVNAAGDICDTDQCQVYDGDQNLQPIAPYHQDVEVAASSTAGLVMCLTRTDPCPAGQVATTQFGASTGGYTVAAAPFPAVEDAGDAVAANPFHTWAPDGYCPTSFSPTEVAAAAGLASLSAIGVERRSGGRALWGGHALAVTVIGRTAGGQASTVVLPAATLAADLGLCSTWVRFPGNF
jgi:hypothetical protein